ncbi:MAG: Flp pilus assembly protein CpaB [Planctomycetota bacterium]|jgi:pilus assembly protein CpaB
MKWAVTVLILMGLVAAVSTAILVQTLRGDPDESSVPSDTVVLAAKSLPAMTVITSDYVTESTVERDELPEEYLSSSVKAVGRVLGVSVVEGQVLTESCFVSKGTGAQLAAALPHGMRAVTITLASRSISGGLLYPGCVVDVLASFKMARSDSKKGRAISTTLLHGIQVLAVEGVSVVSEKSDVEEATGGVLKQRSSSQYLTITLMVDPKQAEALQLARTYGSISLAMRNPLDKYAVDTDATVLSEGQLARLGSTLSPTVMAAKRLLAQVLPGDANDPNGTAFTETVFSERVFHDFFGTEGGTDRPSHWPVTVIRGTEVKEQELDIPEGEDVVTEE